MKRLPTPEFITSLTALLSKKKLFRASSKLQSCALKSLSILMSKPLLEVAPEAMDHVIISGIPLLYVGRNGNEFSGRVLEMMEGSFLAKSHPVLGMLSTVSGGDGNSTILTSLYTVEPLYSNTLLCIQWEPL